MPVCDVCSHVVGDGQGYLLATKQVVVDPRYWEYAFTHQWSFIGSIDLDGRTLPMLVSQQAGQDSAWLVCDSCIDLFSVDRSAERAICKEWWKTGRRLGLSLPGVDPASKSDALKAAMTGWSKTFGFVPVGMGLKPDETTLAAVDQHNRVLGGIIRQASQRVFGL